MSIYLSSLTKYWPEKDDLVSDFIEGTLFSCCISTALTRNLPNDHNIEIIAKRISSGVICGILIYSFSRAEGTKKKTSLIRAVLGCGHGVLGQIISQVAFNTFTRFTGEKRAQFIIVATVFTILKHRYK